MRHALFAAIVAGALVAQGPLAPTAALAAGDGPQQKLEDAERMAEEAARRLMWLLKMMIQNIPQYEMPAINENGDIIIRRKRQPPPAEPPANKENRDQT